MEHAVYCCHLRDPPHIQLSNRIFDEVHQLMQRTTEDTSKKVFVGGLPPSVESEGLRDFFELKFGPVMDAIVISSHSGDHVQSRGFGFVTFKDETSVTAAVQAHYITIVGKKVEIKSAVARSVLPMPDSGPAGSDLATQVEDTKVVGMSEDPVHCDTAEKLQALWLKTASGQQIHGSSSLSLRCGTGTEDTDAFVQPPLRVEGCPPVWIAKFKHWLPMFLREVSSRLKEGEWYPLSSLKGDFRATCGLELDHLGLGYNKLSDFIRSLSEICKMKIVPVGRGPATHMVLLPVPLTNSGASGVCGSSFGPGCAYAVAADVKDDVGLQASIAVKIRQNPLVGPAVPEARSNPSIRKLTVGPGPCTYPTPNKEPTKGKAVDSDDEDPTYLAELLSLLRHKDKDTEDPNSSEVMSSLSHPRNSEVCPPLMQTEGKVESQHVFASICGQEGNIHVSREASFRQCSSSNSLATNCSMYSMWGPKLRCNAYSKDSPQSVLSADFPAYSPHRSPAASFCGASPTESEEEVSKEMCPVCNKRKALWVAVPCSHRAVCTGCKDRLRLSHHSDAKCSICSGLVERWIALH